MYKNREEEKCTKEEFAMNAMFYQGLVVNAFVDFDDNRSLALQKLPATLQLQKQRQR